MTRPVTTASCPTTALPTSSRSDVSAARGSADERVPALDDVARRRGLVALTKSPIVLALAHGLLEVVQLRGECHQRRVVRRLSTVEQAVDLGRGAPGAARRRL